MNAAMLLQLASSVADPAFVAFQVFVCFLLSPARCTFRQKDQGPPCVCVFSGVVYTDPVCFLLSPARCTVRQKDQGQRCVCVFSGTVYTDPGAVAWDNVDGNLTSSLAAFGSGAVSTYNPTGNGVVSTANPTGTDYFTITYTVQVGQYHMSVLQH